MKVRILTLTFFWVAIATAAPTIKEVRKVTPIENTRWIGFTFEGHEMTIDFLSNGAMTYAYNGETHRSASWRQNGEKISWEMNNGYCEFSGKMNAGKIEGNSRNVTGLKWVTTLNQARKE